MKKTAKMSGLEKNMSKIWHIKNGALKGGTVFYVGLLLVSVCRLVDWPITDYRFMARVSPSMVSTVVTIFELA